MSLQSNIIERSFKMNLDNKKLTLTDPNPQMTPEEVCQFYANQYPELTNANIENKGLINDKITIEFNTIIGTKA